MSTKTENSTITFDLATILHDIRADKYTKEIKETFIVESYSTEEKFRISKETMNEIANRIKDDEFIEQLISEGWKASTEIKAGSGLAVKINPNEDFYELTFYIGALGEAFDSSKVIRKSYIKIEKTVLNTIFDYLKYNVKVLAEKAEAQRVKRTNLKL